MCPCLISRFICTVIVCVNNYKDTSSSLCFFYLDLFGFFLFFLLWVYFISLFLTVLCPVSVYFYLLLFLSIYLSIFHPCFILTPFYFSLPTPSRVCPHHFPLCFLFYFHAFPSLFSLSEWDSLWCIMSGPSQPIFHQSCTYSFLHYLWFRTLLHFHIRKDKYDITISASNF